MFWEKRRVFRYGKPVATNLGENCGVIDILRVRNIDILVRVEIDWRRTRGSFDDMLIILLQYRDNILDAGNLIKD